MRKSQHRVPPLNLATLLCLSLLIDFIGFLSYAVPGLGEITDVAWAPVGAFLIQSLYPYLPRRVVWFSFIEELLPGTDFIPTATLSWLYVAYHTQAYHVVYNRHAPKHDLSSVIGVTAWFFFLLWETPVYQPELHSEHHQHDRYKRHE